MMVLILCFSLFSSGEVIDRVLAVVGNKEITKSDISEFQKLVKAGGMYDQRLAVGLEESTLLSDREKALEFLIRQKILDVEVEKRGIETPLEKVEQDINRFARMNNVSRDQLAVALRAQGTDIEEYREFLKKSNQRQTLLQQEILSQIRVTDEDIASYFSKNNRLAGNKIFEYELSHIYFDPNKGGKEAARERAELTLSRLQNQRGSFNELADQYSEERNKEPGGSLGTFKSGEFSKTFENAVKNLDSGEHSQVIAGPSGFHIIKLESRRLITDPRYEAEKERVRNILRQREFQKSLTDWLQRKREELFVRLNTNG